VKKTSAVDQKHQESAEADSRPKDSGHQRPGTDNARYSVQRCCLGEFDELLVLLIATTVMVVMLVVAMSLERRLNVAQKICRHRDGPPLMQWTRCCPVASCCCCCCQWLRRSTVISRDCDSTATPLRRRSMLFTGLAGRKQQITSPPRYSLCGCWALALPSTGHSILSGDAVFQVDSLRPCCSVLIYTACHAKYYMATANPSICRLSVRLSVRHTLALCLNDGSYDHAVFTGRLPTDSKFSLR